MSSVQPSKTLNHVHDYSIDQLKGIGIYFVVLGHLIYETAAGIGLESEGAFWIKSIYAFHMPLFFIISGYLSYFTIQRNNWKVFIYKKAKSLLIPFISWSAMAVVLRVIMRHDLQDGILQSIKENVLRVYVFDLSVWFLLCLFLLALFFYLGYVLSKKIGFFAHIIIFILLILLPNQYFDFRMYGLEYPYFVVGYYLNSSLNNGRISGRGILARFQISKRNTFIVAFVCLAVSILGYIFKLPIYNAVAVEEIRSPLEATQMIYGYFWALIMCLGFMMIAKTFCRNAEGKASKLLTMIGNTSIDIYGQHMVLVYIVMNAATHMLDISLPSFFVFCIVASLAMSVACALITKYALRKVSLYSMLFSGR